MNPALLIELFKGSSSVMYQLRETLIQLPGVTSFTNLQALFLVLVLLYPRLYLKPAPYFLKFWLWIIIIFCIVRVFAWSERLALIEMLLPWVILSFSSQPFQIVQQLKLKFAPILGFVSIFIFFAIGEYFRSWQFYQFQWDSYSYFIFNRFSAYYATSLNNGYGYWTNNGTQYNLENIAGWIYKIPIWGWLGIFESQESNYAEFLTLILNPEYNNRSGIYIILTDVGPWFGFILWTIIGYYTGKIAKGFTEEKLIPLIVYPLIFISVVEILRIFYIGETRFFPVIVAIIIISLSFRKNKLFVT